MKRITFETPARYYFRLRNNQGHLVASVDKKTGETLVEKCEQPVSLAELSAATLQHGMLGTRSYQGFPVWGSMAGVDLVQVVTAGELDFYKSLHSISIPDQLKGLEEDSNPVFIFYKLKGV